MRKFRIIKNRKGGASVAIAVIMAMIVAVSFVNQILIWGQFLNSEDRDRLNESIEVVSIEFDEGDIVVNVKNTGSVTAHIVALYIEPTNTEKETARYGLEEGIDNYLDPENTKDIAKGLVSDPGLEPISDEFIATVVTERGNSDSETYIYELSSMFNREVGELGVFRTNWFFSKYVSKRYPPGPYGYLPIESPPSPILNDAVYLYKNDSYIAFVVEIKNIWNRACGIEFTSFFALNSIQPTGGGGNPYFYIVNGVHYNDTVTPIIKPYTDPVIVLPEEHAFLIFASEDPGTALWKWSEGWESPWGKPGRTEASGITVSLIYTIYDMDGEPTPTTETYGQTISTQAVILYGTGE